MSQKYFTIKELLDMVEEPNRSSCIKLYEDHKDIFNKAEGSKTKHQAWEGGYYSHIREIMNIAYRIYQDLNTCRPLPFTLSDALFVLWIHDLEKPFKYAGSEEQKEELKIHKDYKEFILNKLEKYNIELNENQMNAFKYVHGEGEDYDPYIRIQGPLAAFVHICDTFSARIWFDEPKDRNSW